MQNVPALPTWGLRITDNAAMAGSGLLILDCRHELASTRDPQRQLGLLKVEQARLRGFHPSLASREP